MQGGAQFFEARDRFYKAQMGQKSAPVKSYVRDIVEQYGSGGQPINLPKLAQDDYNRALHFRNEEKKHYKNLEEELKKTKIDLEEQREIATSFGQFFEYLQDRMQINEQSRISRRQLKRNERPTDRSGSSGSDTVEQHVVEESSKEDGVGADAGGEPPAVEGGGDSRGHASEHGVEG